MHIFDIILFALIAIFLVLRLRGVLGNRDGYDGKDKDKNLGGFFKRDQKKDEEDNVIEMPGLIANKADPAAEAAEAATAEDEQFEGPLGEGIKVIRAADPSFNAKEFLEGSSFAFEMILNAYAEGDAKALKPLLNSEVYGGFAQAIESREAESQTLSETLVGINSAELMEAYMDGREAHITVKFVSEQISALMDSEGTVIEGDLVKVVKATDFWTFARSTKSRNPNWTLVGTGALE